MESGRGERRGEERGRERIPPLPEGRQDAGWGTSGR